MIERRSGGLWGRVVAAAAMAVVAVCGWAAQPALAAAVTGSKSVAGTFAPGGTVTYTITLTNAKGGPQLDNPGNELVDVLPATLNLVSATATSGTANANVATNTVTWNGAIPEGGSVVITITATVNAVPGATVDNQASINYDADGNGTNESSTATDQASFMVAAYPLAVDDARAVPTPAGPIADVADTRAGRSPGAAVTLVAVAGLVAVEVGVGRRRRHRADRSAQRRA